MASPGTRLAAPRRTRRCPELADGQQCQKRRGVKGRQPDRPASEGIRSLEVRWIFPGQLGTAVAGWFAASRPPGNTRGHLFPQPAPAPAVREDPRRRGSGGQGIPREPRNLDVARCARGRLESWHKWSFPCDPLGQGSGDPAGWRPVRKWGGSPDASARWQCPKISGTGHIVLIPFVDLDPF